MPETSKPETPENVRKMGPKSSATGIILIAFGIVLLLNQFRVVGEEVFLYFLSIGFLGAYKWVGGSKRYGSIGFLIPGCIILAVALFNDVGRLFGNRIFGPGWFFILLGCAFLAIYFIHTRIAGTDSGGKQWPLYPAAGLGVFGLFIAIVTQLDAVRTSAIFNYGLPVLVILAGVIIMWRAQNR